jgi:hypothetical protein
MTSATRRGMMTGASAMIALARKARSAVPVPLGILTDPSGLYSQDAGTKIDTYGSLAGAWFDLEGVDVIVDISCSAV